MRRVLRGYRLLRKSGRLGLIADLNNELANLPLHIDPAKFSATLFGAGIADAETICRQLLLTRVAGGELNASLLLSLGSGSPLAAHLPPEWREFISRRGFVLPGISAALRWRAFLAVMLLAGMFRIGKLITGGVAAFFAAPARPLRRYVYFDTLSKGNLPGPCRDGRSHDIISWYRQWEGRTRDIDTIAHGVVGAADCEVQGTSVTYLPAPLPPLWDPARLTKFAFWSGRATLRAAVDLFRGRWWHALLLPQAALAAQARLLDPSLLAKEYLFHNSGYTYRPLWTYEAERCGSKITFYFYSTNCEPFKIGEGYRDPFAWNVMTWPHYLVWDECQADFVRRAVGERGTIEVVGPIWFAATAEEMPEIGREGVAVFDVTPFRTSKFATLCIDPEYYVPGTCIGFLRDVRDCLDEAGYRMLWKRKRKIGSMAHPLYRFYADEIAKRDNVTIVDSDVSAYRVIEASAAVISMSFTSTAHIARELGKPTCYYDPHGMIQRDDRAAHGIPIVTGREELGAWLKEVAASRGRWEGDLRLDPGHPASRSAGVSLAAR